jgi:hypothetical protein
MDERENRKGERNRNRERLKGEKENEKVRKFERTGRNIKREK